jgi:hypothetical protein
MDPLDAEERQAVIDAVLGLGWEWSYKEDGVDRPLSADDREMLTRSDFLRLDAAPRPGFWFHWWLYADEVEIDVDPRDIVCQDELDCVCDLVLAIGGSIGGRVFAGIEGARTSPLMWFEPESGDIVVGDVPEPEPPSLWSRVLQSVRRRVR